MMNLEAQNLVFLKFLHIDNFYASVFTNSSFCSSNSAMEFQIGTAKVRFIQIWPNARYWGRTPIVLVINPLGKRKLRRQVFAIYSLSKIVKMRAVSKVCRSVMTLFRWWSGSNAMHVGRKLLFYIYSVGIWFFTQTGSWKYEENVSSTFCSC